MRAPRFSTGILAGALVVPLLLSACGGGDDSIADPPISSAPTSSPTGAPQQESPEHFIRRFYRAEINMENTGRMKSYEAMFNGCKPCSSLVTRVQSIYTSGGFIRWGGLTIKSIAETGTGHSGKTFTIRFDARKTTYRESAGGPLKTLVGGPSSDLLTLQNANGHWLVTARARTAS
jgi:hypothetical protein